MPYEVNEVRYACKYCNTRYDNYTGASLCEDICKLQEEELGKREKL